MAGAIYASYMALINPFSFGVGLSISFLIMIVVGGLGSVPGSILGVVILETLPEFAREWENYRLAGYGILLVLLIIFAPRGVAGLLSTLFRFLGKLLQSREKSSLKGSSTHADR